MKAAIDSFSGGAAGLKRGHHTLVDVLRAIDACPRVSTWDMSELSWLRDAIHTLLRDGLIVETDEPYPWHRYRLTPAGKARLGL